MLMSVDPTSTGLEKNTNLFLSQNLSDYNNKIAFHCRELRQKKAGRFDVGIWWENFYQNPR